MEWFENVLNGLDSVLGSAVYFPILLLGMGLFFTLYLGVPQVRFFKHAWGVLFGRYDDPSAKGDTTHFQSLSTALSGTVGTGNIGGVAFAIYLGGPAALFWMWATAFVGMTTKYAEVTISHKYRVTDEQGHIAGGPMYYMDRGLNMRWLAVFFAIATVVSSFGSGNLPQSNNMAAGMETSFGVEPWITGAVLSVLLGAVIIGGIRRIAVVAATIVPFMALLYAVGALAVAATHYDNLWPSFVSVWSDAFSGSAAAGGFLGATFAYAFNRGVNRGLFSNEAGQGSAPIAHAAARTKDAPAEGVVAILEPFIDTLVICTLTGIVILASGVWTQKHETGFATFDTEFVAGQWSDNQPADVERLFAHMDLVPPSDDPVKAFSGTINVVNGHPTSTGWTVLHNRSVGEDVQFLDAAGAPWSGAIDVADGNVATDGVTVTGRSLLHSVALTAKAFSTSFLGVYGEYTVTIGLVLFAFSTALAWSYYGDRAVTYLVGVRWILPYRVLYLGGFFLATIADTSLIWLISAITLALMTLPNLAGIFMMRKEIKGMTQDYWLQVKERKVAAQGADKAGDA